MPQRQKIGIDLNTNRTVTPTTVGVTQERPVAVDEPVNSVATAALQGLVKLGAKKAEEAVVRGAEEAYIEGQRARATGESLESVESDIFSRKFARRGYAEMDYRMFQSEFMDGMKEFIVNDGKNLEPEEFVSALRERSGEVMDAITKQLPIDKRARAIQSQVSAEDVLIKAHAKAYRDNNIAQAGKRYTIQGNEINTTLAQARMSGDTEAIIAANQRAAFMVEDILNSDALPEEMRNEVATNFVGAMLKADNHETVSGMLDNGIFDTLSFKQRSDISTSLREAKSRTRARDLLATYESGAAFEASIDNGHATPDAVRQYVQMGVDNGQSGAWAQGVWDSFYKSKSDHELWDQAFMYLQQGDVNGIHSLGLDPADVVVEMDNRAASKNIPLEDRTVGMIKYGMQIGAMPKKVAQYVGGAVMAMTSAINNNQDMNPSQLALVRNTVDTVISEQGRSKAAQSTFLSALPEKLQGTVGYVIDQGKQGVPVEQALQEAVFKTKEFKTLTGGVQHRLTEEFKTKLQQGSSLNWFTRTFLADDPYNMMKDTSQNPANLSAMHAAVLEEFQAMGRDRSYVALFDTWDDNAQDILTQTAIARSKARAITIPGAEATFDINMRGMGNVYDPGKGNDGAVFLPLPKNTSVGTVFGVDLPNDPAVLQRVGVALSENYPPAASGLTSMFRFDALGRLLNYQADEDGLPVGSPKLVDTAAIGKRVLDIQSNIMQYHTEPKLGKDVVVKDSVLTTEHRVKEFGTGIETPFKFDGNNTANLPSRSTLDWRLDLVEHEGYVSKVYVGGVDKEIAKSKGKEPVKTFGFGTLVQPGDKFKEGDAIPPELALSRFNHASDTALVKAKRIADGLGIITGSGAPTGDISAVYGLASAVYQMGDFAFPKAKEALQARDWDAFVRETKDSAWYRQTPKRVTRFLEYMKPYFE